MRFVTIRFMKKRAACKLRRKMTGNLRAKRKFPRAWKFNPLTSDRSPRAGIAPPIVPRVGSREFLPLDGKSFSAGNPFAILFPPRVLGKLAGNFRERRHENCVHEKVGVPRGGLRRNARTSPGDCHMPRWWTLRIHGARTEGSSKLSPRYPVSSASAFA